MQPCFSATSRLRWREEHRHIVCKCNSLKLLSIHMLIIYCTHLPSVSFNPKKIQISPSLHFLCLFRVSRYRNVLQGLPSPKPESLPYDAQVLLVQLASKIYLPNFRYRQRIWCWDSREQTQSLSGSRSCRLIQPNSPRQCFFPSFLSGSPMFC
jgi:hypothetical protein